jgi:hypothetical protein
MPAAQPQTREFRAFQTNLEYARKMIVAGRSLATFQSPVIDIGDFYRAAWVQAVSAIDRRPITDADVTDAIDWIERIALAIATVLG